MAKRRKIGIVFAESEAWAGGFYYVLNIIKSLNYLADNQKPLLVVFIIDDTHKNTISEIGYPYLIFKPLYKQSNLLIKFCNKVSYKLFKINIINGFTYNKNEVDFAYPINYYSNFTSLANIKGLYWIPDFQHYHLPENFNAQTLALRKQKTDLIINNNYSIVLSSNDAKKDLINAYPEAKNEINVLHFPSILPIVSEDEIEQAKTKFSIQGDYFLSANQFWKHKNQLTLLKAIKKISDINQSIKVVFTGNMTQHCDPEYVKILLDYVENNHLADRVCFLGFIDRSDQIALIKGCLAVVQPSFFEGWSTIVEDCKALNHYLILSDLDVHKEQINENVLFFKRKDSNDLAEKLLKFTKEKPVTLVKSYQLNILNFANRIINIK